MTIARGKRIVGALLLAVLAVACGDSDDGGGSGSASTDSGGRDNSDQAATADTCDDVDLASAPSAPTTIRMGFGLAAEEQLWLQQHAPDVANAAYSGSWYEIDGAPYQPNDRLDAYQAGELDAVSVSTPQLIRAVSAGLDLAAAVSISLESSDTDAFRTSFAALKDGPIQGIEDLRGAKIGIPGPTTTSEYLVKSAVTKAGLDPDRDVELVVLPFPEQEQALRDGTIDVAELVEPFYSIAHAKGGLVDVFDSLTGSGFDQELLMVAFDKEWVVDNEGAYCAWRSDFVAATESYLEDRRAAGEALIEAGMVRAPSVDAFLQSQDYARRPTAAIDVAGLDLIQQDMVKSKFIRPEQAVDAESLVLAGFALVQ